jgi:hypothetical protein
MFRGRPYDGQPHTDTGIRGKTEVKGVTFRDLRDCYLRAYCQSFGADVEPNNTLYFEAQKGEAACICENDIFGLEGDVDPIAVFQNFACEVEKLMGIFPNLPEEECDEVRKIKGFLRGDE